ncbi:hypothetical protein J3F84DRAFT_15436 [Trichoderma pleuroticola]
MLASSFFLVCFSFWRLYALEVAMCTVLTRLQRERENELLLQHECIGGACLLGNQTQGRAYESTPSCISKCNQPRQGHAILPLPAAHSSISCSIHPSIHPSQLMLCCLCALYLTRFIRVPLIEVCTESTYSFSTAQCIPAHTKWFCCSYKYYQVLIHSCLFLSIVESSIPSLSAA